MAQIGRECCSKVIVVEKDGESNCTMKLNERTLKVVSKIVYLNAVIDKNSGWRKIVWRKSWGYNKYIT